MSKKNTIIRGTLVLTMAGFLCRVMGFFYRIFLSHTFGEESVGLYQLVFPVFAFCLSLTCAGLETAISRTVARKMSLGRRSEAREILTLGMLVTGFISVIMVLFLQKNAAFFAVQILDEPRCELLLMILSYAIPFASLHTCIAGYCFGLKQTKIPALSQLLEQVVRITCVAFLYYFLSANKEEASIAIAAAGLVLGEIASTLYSLHALNRSGVHILRPRPRLAVLKLRFGELIPLTLPLTANRVLINLLQSIEAISIPGCLKLYSHSTSEALSIYGVLTGMALPCILFPSAITSSVSIMLMPAVAEIQAADSPRKMQELLKKVLGACFILGLSCCLFFLLFGPLIGRLLFDSEMAGDFIITLAWICPFLYVNSSLQSVINGLGKTTTTFLINAASLLIRIGSVFLAVPLFGIKGYLWGMLLSQLVVSLLSGMVLMRYLRENG